MARVGTAIRGAGAVLCTFGSLYLLTSCSSDDDTDASQAAGPASSTAEGGANTGGAGQGRGLGGDGLVSAPPGKRILHGGAPGSGSGGGTNGSTGGTGAGDGSGGDVAKPEGCFATLLPVGEGTLECGDGALDPGEVCDDGQLAVEDDACDAECKPRDFLVVRPSGSPPFPSTLARKLGIGRHPVAATCEGFAAAFHESESSPERVAVSFLRADGFRVGQPVFVDEGTNVPDEPRPVVVGMGDGSIAIAFNELGGDGDGLGVALRRVDPADAEPVGALSFASDEALRGQRDPDLVWDAANQQLVVAYVQEGHQSTGADLRFRLFDSDLVPLGPSAYLANQIGSEQGVSLAATESGWASAWHELDVGKTNITAAVFDGSTTEIARWRLEPLWPTADRPSIVQLDAAHLLMVFTEGTDGHGTGIHSVPRLRYAILDIADTSRPGFLPLDPMVAPFNTDESVAQEHPAAISMGDGRLLIAWHSGVAVGDVHLAETWIKTVTWDEATSTLDLTAPELPAPRAVENRHMDQFFPALVKHPRLASGPNVLVAWNDHQSPGDVDRGQPDVMAALIDPAVPPPSAVGLSFGGSGGTGGAGGAPSTGGIAGGGVGGYSVGGFGGGGGAL